MKNYEFIKGMTTEQLAMFLFKWQVVTTSMGLEMRFNELLNAKDMVKWLKSDDNTIIYQLMSADWSEQEIDFKKFIDTEGRMNEKTNSI